MFEQAPQARTCVVQRLVERVAVGREAVGEDVDRHAVDGQREQDVALVRREARDRRCDAREQLARLRRLGGVVRERAELLQALARVRGQLAIPPGVAANGDAGRVDRELLGPGREPAAPLEALEP